MNTFFKMAASKSSEISISIASTTSFRNHENMDPCPISEDTKFSKVKLDSICHPYSALDNYYNRFVNINSSNPTSVIYGYKKYNLDGATIYPNIIACSCPTIESAAQFYYAAHSYKIHDTFVLCMLNDRDDQRTFAYFPRHIGNTMDFYDWNTNMIVKATCEKINEIQNENAELISIEYTIHYTITIKDAIMDGEIVFHNFLRWADHSVPAMNEFEDLIKQGYGIYTHLKSNEHICVHCSAGVGRTGVFISCLIAMLEHSQTPFTPDEKIDIAGAIKSLRQHRTMMVQTIGQYQFIQTFIRRLASGKFLFC